VIRTGGALQASDLGRPRHQLPPLAFHYSSEPPPPKLVLFMTATDLETVTEGVWSVDGKIYFNRYSDHRRGIFRLNTETRERRVLYVPPPGVDIKRENLALSPDGGTLAFHARNDASKTASLMLLSVDGSRCDS
jgi:hypothetical protein